MLERLRAIAAQILNHLHIIGFWSMGVEVKEVIEVIDRNDLFWVVATSKIHHPNYENENLEVYLMDQAGSLFSRGPRFDAYGAADKTKLPAFLPLAGIKVEHCNLGGTREWSMSSDGYPSEVSYRVTDEGFEFVSVDKPSRHYAYTRVTDRSVGGVEQEYVLPAQEDSKKVVSIKILEGGRVTTRTVQYGHLKTETFQLESYQRQSE